MSEQLPLILEHCMNLYDAMYEESDQYRADSPDIREWRGQLSKLFPKIDLTPTNYSRIVGMMRRMGCIEQVRRGNANSESVWLLMQRPTKELHDWVKSDEAESTQEQEYNSSIEQRLRDLSSSFGEMYQALQNLGEAVEALETRIGFLEDEAEKNASIE